MRGPVSAAKAIEKMGWQRVAFAEVMRRTGLKRGPERWKWRTEKQRGRTQLVLVEATGERWDFKLQRGAWMRKQELC